MLVWGRHLATVLTQLGCMCISSVGLRGKDISCWPSSQQKHNPLYSFVDLPKLIYTGKVANSKRWARTSSITACNFCMNSIVAFAVP